MAEEFKEIRTTRVRDEPEHMRRSLVVHDPPATTAARLVYVVLGITLGLLAFRVILSLLGANRGAPFADFIYTVSYPFVAPFFGLFNYQVQYGISRFEIETIIAMLVYALIGTLIIDALTASGSRTHHYHYR